MLPEPVCYGTASPNAATRFSVIPASLSGLRDRIAAGIIDGTWGPGQMLPSVRALAALEGANPLTVAKAYQQFQDDGLVRVQRGIGMFVEQGAAKTLRLQQRAVFLHEEWPAIAARIRLLGIEPTHLPAFVKTFDTGTIGDFSYS